MKGKFILFFVISIVFSLNVYAHGESGKIPGYYWVRIEAKDKYERTKIVETGFSIDAIYSDSVYGVASPQVFQELKKSGFKIIESFQFKEENSLVEALDFPPQDSRFHNYKEMTDALVSLNKKYSAITRLFSVGKTVEGRDILAFHINTSLSRFNYDCKNGYCRRFVSGKPGILFVGNHHAREHVSAETPLMILEFLLNQYNKDQEVTRLLNTRDIYFIPMLNADGAEYDIVDGRYRYHRKNMRRNSDGSIGVDLNRNYGYKWGTGGSSTNPSSDVYMGPAPFSEPETQAIKKFVDERPNIKILLTFHTYSELILYPWGHTYDPINNEKDRLAFEAMAKKMASWNRYKPQQSSDLYIASGDTCDWAYGEKNIFCFTFELSPASQWQGGFYPGAKILDKVFQDNLKPALYLIDLADNPYRSIDSFYNNLWL
jgi:carboxypeptidase T